MGPVSFRGYFALSGTDRSALGAQVEAQRARVRARLADVRAVVAVLSGKGGVGKSYVSAGLAVGAAREGRAVGVLDADLRSPTVARLLEAHGPLHVTDDGVHPAIGTAGTRVVSSDHLLAEGQPLTWREPEAERFVWRSTLETGALREFLSDVVWGPLDLLVIDLPPGADGVTDVAALVPDLYGAVAVTIPSDESRRSVERTLRAASNAGIRVLGIVENMAGYHCPECRMVRPLFAGDAGAQLARAFGAPLLGSIPFSPTPSPQFAETIARTVGLLP